MLSPACASLLLGELEPSPAPEVKVPPRMLEAEDADEGHGFMVVETTSADGRVQRFTRPASALGLSSIFGPSASAPRSAMLSPVEERGAPPFAAMMALPILSGFLPPEIAAVLSSPSFFEGQLELRRPPEPEPHHPCQHQAVCQRETSDHAHLDAGLECLVRHLDQLSPDCKCFVHQVTGGRLIGSPTARSPVPSQAARVAVRTVEPSVPSVVVVDPVPPQAMGGQADHDQHAHHRLSCLLVFTLLFFFTFLFVRSCLTLLCMRRPRHVVVVPPEQTQIATTGPLLISEVVQVAEPVSKPVKA